MNFRWTCILSSYELTLVQFVEICIQYISYWKTQQTIMLTTKEVKQTDIELSVFLMHLNKFGVTWDNSGAKSPVELCA